MRLNKQSELILIIRLFRPKGAYDIGYNDTLKRSKTIKSTLLEKIIGFCSIAGLTAMVVLMVKDNSIFFYTESTSFALISFTLFIVVSLYTLFPNLLWKLEKFRISINANVDSDIEPSEFFLIGRKILIYGGFGIAVLGLISSLLRVIRY